MSCEVKCRTPMAFIAERYVGPGSWVAVVNASAFAAGIRAAQRHVLAAGSGRVLTLPRRAAISL